MVSHAMVKAYLLRNANWMRIEMVERLTNFVCVICGKPVLLQECTTNAFGEPVHRDCYAAFLKGEAKKKPKPASNS